jgi:outer membrane protein OmpA-like peptidoglycan-associated protein
MAEWGLSLPGANASLGTLYVMYGNGIPPCVEEWMPNVDWEDPEVIEIPIRITQKEDRFCVAIPGDLLFDFDKDFIKENVKAKNHKEMTPGQRALHEVARVIRATPERRVSIVGYTDSIGEDTYNQGLSERRANSVARWLTDPTKGKVKAPDIIAKGLGEANPVVDNRNQAPTEANKKAQAPNRRVDICLIPR